METIFENSNEQNNNDDVGYVLVIEMYIFY